MNESQFFKVGPGAARQRRLSGTGLTGKGREWTPASGAKNGANDAKAARLRGSQLRPEGGQPREVRTCFRGRAWDARPRRLLPSTTEAKTRRPALQGAGSQPTRGPWGSRPWLGRPEPLTPVESASGKLRMCAQGGGGLRREESSARRRGTRVGEDSRRAWRCLACPSSALVGFLNSRWSGAPSCVPTCAGPARCRGPGGIAPLGGQRERLPGSRTLGNPGVFRVTVAGTFLVLLSFWCEKDT